MIDSAGIILVEGVSDRAAVETLARRMGRDLEAEAVSVVAMGGASPIAEHLSQIESHKRLAGMCDQAEESEFKKALEFAGYGADLSREDMETLGFYVCVEDLEDELIRALSVDGVEVVVEQQGDLRSLRSMQNQPAWRGRPKVDQLRRFFGAGAGRKTRYARLLVEACEMERIPRPLMGVIESV